MQYAVVFDLAQAGYRTWWVPAIFVAAADYGVAGLLSNPRRFPDNLVFLGWVGFALAIATLTFAVTFGEYTRLKTALQAGQVSIAEGKVTSFESLPKRERFCVESACFEYSQFDATAGFNHTATTGGPIERMVQVRVWYVDQSIVRLEILSVLGRRPRHSGSGMHLRPASKNA